MVQLPSLIAVLAMGVLTSAHPGQTDIEKRAEAEARRSYLASLGNTNLMRCGPKLQARGVVERSIARRRETLVNIRKRAGIVLDPKIEKRQAQQYAFKDTLAKDHRSKLNLASSWKNADWTVLGQNQSVVLHPEVTEGPYYVTGEYIRRDVREKEKGVTIHLDLQVIDIKTCEPVKDSAVEIWASNATGVYSGVGAELMMGDMANGLTDKASIAANVQNQALRGIQITNKDGSVQFDTIFPGHYSGRTNHIHVMTHRNQTVLANNTISGGTVNHVGQIYFDQSLIDEVEKTQHYLNNKNMHMYNRQDMLMAAGTEGLADNVVNYVLVGNKLEDGIFAWLNFGVDTDYSRNVRAATACGEKGCAAVPFNFAEEMGKFFGGKGKGGKGKGDPPPFPSMPAGGIPGLEMGAFPFPGGPGGPPGKGGKGPGGKGGPPGMPDFASILGGLSGGAKGPGAPPAPGGGAPDLSGLLGGLLGGAKAGGGAPAPPSEGLTNLLGGLFGGAKGPQTPGAPKIPGANMARS